MSEHIEIVLLVVAVLLFSAGIVMGARWNSPVRRHRAWVQSAEAEEMD